MAVLANWLARQRVPEHCASAARRALAAIARCRTPASGGHVYRCTACTRPHFAYHSCHHRACPRCGGADTAAWAAKQQARLLPVPNFLVTFTLPEELRPAFAARPALMHSVLFNESAATLQQVAAVPRSLGAELGFVGVLHTWGRQLQHHPHVHYIVPGGGLRPDARKWIGARQPDWLLPVKKLAAVLRNRIDAAMRESAPDLHAPVPDSVRRARWVVHCQSAGSGEATVRYFGWMHPAARKRRMLVETLLAKPIVVAPVPPQPLLHLRCPRCERFTLVRVATLVKQARACPETVERAPPAGVAA